MRNEENLDQSLYCMIYTLEILHYKGLSIRGTIRESLGYLKNWYQMTGERRYLELAVLQIRAGFQLKMLSAEDLEFYHEMCEQMSLTLEDILKENLLIAKEVKLNRAQIKGMIRKWMPSKKNPMTIMQVVDDIIDKVTNQRFGHYYYRYTRGQGDNTQEDIYELAINESECYFLDIKDFKMYTFKEEEI